MESKQFLHQNSDQLPDHEFQNKSFLFHFFFLTLKNRFLEIYNSTIEKRGKVFLLEINVQICLILSLCDGSCLF